MLNKELLIYQNQYKMFNYLLCTVEYTTNSFVLQIKSGFVNSVEADLHANQYYNNEQYCIIDILKGNIYRNRTNFKNEILIKSINDEQI